MSLERKAYETRLGQQLVRLVAEIVRIKAKVGPTGVDTRVRFDRVAVSLQRIHDDLAQHLHALQEASDAAWETLRNGPSPARLRVSAAFGPKTLIPERIQG